MWDKVYYMDDWDTEVVRHKVKTRVLHVYHMGANVSLFTVEKHVADIDYCYVFN